MKIAKPLRLFSFQFSIKWHLNQLCIIYLCWVIWRERKMQLPKIGHSISKIKFCFKDSLFFSKCSFFSAESEYQIRKFLQTLDFYKNLVFSTPIAEKPRFSGNLTCEHFGENFLETKRKSTSRNPYKPRDSSICSAVIKMIFSCNTPIE